MSQLAHFPYFQICVARGKEKGLAKVTFTNLEIKEKGLAGSTTPDRTHKLPVCTRLKIKVDANLSSEITRAFGRGHELHTSV